MLCCVVLRCVALCCVVLCSVLLWFVLFCCVSPVLFVTMYVLYFKYRKKPIKKIYIKKKGNKLKRARNIDQRMTHCVAYVPSTVCPDERPKHWIKFLTVCGSFSLSEIAFWIYDVIIRDPFLNIWCHYQRSLSFSPRHRSPTFEVCICLFLKSSICS